MTQPCDLEAVEARRLIGLKQLSPVELLDSCLGRIEDIDGSLNAITASDAKGARKAAKDAESKALKGEPLELLHGLPVAVKDLQATRGLRTTWGSLIYKDHVPDADDPMVANVRAAGGIIFAKTNTPEFGAGANTTNKIFGATGNPFDPQKTCGGSSGGAAVAVATGMAPLATGSDHGGSLRTPAAFCGVAGYRPSPGLIPRTTTPVSLLPMPVAGPMGRTVADAHLLLKAQLDFDKRDPYSSDDLLRIPDVLSGVDLGTLRVAVSTDLGCAPIDKKIAKTFKARMKTIGGMFREIQNRDPDLTGVHESFEVLRAIHFVAAHKERLEKHRELLGPNVINNTARGLKYTMSDVAKAHATQTLLYKKFVELFEEVDILICPAAAVSPFPHSQLFVESVNGENMPTYMRWLAITYALTMALPAACCLPCGKDHMGMPFGIQVVGPNGSDALVLEVSHALEKALAGMTETARPLPDISGLSKRRNA